jgi:diguanylate cyclase (GGDEF)-like protein
MSTGGTGRNIGTRVAQARAGLALLGRRLAQRRGDQYTQAYAASLSQRLPLLYTVVVFVVLLLAIRFAGDAPTLLVLAGPATIGTYAAWRAVYWLPGAVHRRDLVRVRRDLDAMGGVGAAGALCFIGWALSLYGHGDVAQRDLIYYMISLLLFSAVLGLGHAPLTALWMAIAMTVPVTIALMVRDDSNALYIALSQLVVTPLLLLVNMAYHRDFVRLEQSRQQIERRELAAARLARTNYLQATVDPLTGAMNRRAILLRLEREFDTGHTNYPWLALVDLDGFKHVNDTYGHAAGDTVLQAVANRIAAHPAVIACGRLGGDEFVLLFDGAGDAEQVRRFARNLSELIRAPILHKGATLRLTASIGLRRTDGLTVSECLERVDAALYKAKEEGDGAVAIFDDDDEIALQQRIAITRQFNDCTLDDRLKLVYQPMFDVSQNRIVGFEAFARWSPDGENWMAPGEFMALAVATGRTGELTRLVLARALSECRAWEQGLTLAVNLAPRDVMREGCPEVLEAIVRAAGTSPESIVLEVTEGALLGDPRRAAAQLERLREKGFRIALDDFGSGWSGLSNINALSIDFIKLDKRLVQALPTDPGARAIASTIVALAWQLGIQCTAEGIEDAAQAETARALGITLMQGYHFGRPGPAAAAMDLLAKAA